VFKDDLLIARYYFRTHTGTYRGRQLITPDVLLVQCNECGCYYPKGQVQQECVIEEDTE